MVRNDAGKEGEVPPAECHPGGTAATRQALLGPGDAELFHLLLQSGTLHSQAGRGPLRTAHHPASFAEDAEDEFLVAGEHMEALRKAGVPFEDLTASPVKHGKAPAG